MARIHIDLPSVVHFNTEIPVRITDINYGGHLANDALLGIIHEARAQFYLHCGYEESNIEGVSTIMADVAIQFKAEVFYGDTLLVTIAATEFMRVSYDLYYSFVSKKTQQEVARAKTHLVFYDYDQRRIRAIPRAFQQLFVSPTTLI